MKPKVLIILLFISLYACNTSLKPDDDFGIEQKNDGEFVGEFVEFVAEEGNSHWSIPKRLIFKSGNGDSVFVYDIIENDWSNDKILQSEGKMFSWSEVLPRTSLLDSIVNHPENFYGKLFKVRWSKFYFKQDDITGGTDDESIPFKDNITNDTPILLSISRPFENKNRSIDNEKQSSEERSNNENTNNPSNLTTENASSNLNNKSFSEIRGLIISGKRNTVIDVLGEPNEKLLGSDYSVKYLHFKLGMRHELTLMDYLVWIYNIDENELLVVFDKEDKVCKVAYSKDIKQPYDLTE